METPWLSVVMTSYNGSEYLAEALESVAAQAGPDVEIIVVDDGSTDDTMDVLGRYAARLPTMEVVARDHGGNWVANMNLGLRMARGRYATLLHHDDLWLPGRLAVARRILDADPTIALLLHAADFIDARGRRLGTWRCPLPKGRRLEPGRVIERLLIQNFIAMPTPIFRREAALRIGGMNEDLWQAADWDFWLGLAAQGATTYVGRSLTSYRVHPLATTWIWTDRSAAFRWQMEDVLDRHLAAWEAGRTPNSALRRTARFSIEANVRLAACAHGHPARLANLAFRFLGLGPGGWRRYLRDSRLHERAGARIRAGMLRWRRQHGIDPAACQGSRLTARAKAAALGGEANAVQTARSGEAS